MTTLTLTNARIIDPETGRDEPGHILIDGGQISGIGPAISPQGDILDVKGAIAAPGLIDMRVLTGEPGAENRESIASAAQAAAIGGVTSIVIMPDTNPVIDDMSLVEYIQNRGRETDISVLVAGALTKKLDGKTLTEIGMMSERGAVMFSNGATPIADSLIMRRILSYSARFNALVSNRCKDPALTNGACAHESDFSSRLGLNGSPSTAERIMVERDIALAELTGGRLLIDMISSEDAVNAIRNAKRRDIEIASSVSINHLCLNEIDIGDYRTFAKLDPPLREETDRLALLDAVNDGTIDVVVSAHDPRPAGEKRLPFAEASPGAVGLELLLAAGLSQVADDKLDLMAFLKTVTINPATLLDLPSGRLQEGAPADIVIFDPSKPWVCNSDTLSSKSNNTPFDTRRMTGKVMATLSAGKLVHNSFSE